MWPNFEWMLERVRSFVQPFWPGTEDAGNQSFDEIANLAKLQDGRNEIGQKLLELKELSKKRDDELKSIQLTIKECKTKVVLLGKTHDENAQLHQIGMQRLWQYFSKRKLRHPGTVRFIGGIILLLFLLTYNWRSALTPNIPTFYGILHVVVVIYHLAFITGKPIHTFLLQLGGIVEQLPVNTDIFLEDRGIGIFLSSISIVLLKLRKCNTCGSCIQIFFSTLAYLMEIHDVSYFDFVEPEDINNSVSAAQKNEGSITGNIDPIIQKNCALVHSKTLVEALPYVQLINIITYFLIM